MAPSAWFSNAASARQGSSRRRPRTAPARRRTCSQRRSLPPTASAHRPEAEPQDDRARDGRREKAGAGRGGRRSGVHLRRAPGPRRNRRGRRGVAAIAEGRQRLPSRRAQARGRLRLLRELSLLASLQDWRSSRRGGPDARRRANAFRPRRRFVGQAVVRRRAGSLVR